MTYLSDIISVDKWLYLAICDTTKIAAEYFDGIYSFDEWFENELLVRLEKMDKWKFDYAKDNKESFRAFYKILKK